MNAPTPSSPGVEDRVSERAPPTGYRIEQAMSAWQSARTRLLTDDADLAHDEAALTALLGPETGDVRDVLSRLLQATQTAAALSDAANEMLANLKGRQDRYRRRVEQFRSTVFAIMDAIGERRFETAAFTVSIAAGRPSAIITDEALIPDRFVKITTERKVDKVLLLSALRDGEVIEGAAISNSLPTLTVRSR